MRRRSSWHLAGIAGLILALTPGCKDDNGGRAPIDEDADVPDGAIPGEGGSPEAGPGNPDTSVPDTGAPDTGPGNDPDSGNPDGGSPDAGDSGQPVPEGIADKASVDFGLSNCGGDAPGSQTFKLTNTGSAPITYTVTLSNSTAFSIEGATGGSKSGTVAPGTDVSVTLNAAAVPASASAGVAINATATVTTNLPAPNNSFVIPLKVTPQGAHLQLNPAGGADWILVQTGEGATFTPVTLQNSGNVPAAVTVTQPINDAFDLYTGTSTTELAAALNVPAAGSGGPGAQALNASFNPLTNGAYTSKATLVVAGAVCNGGTSASLTEIPFEGAASNSGLSVQRTPFADRVNCGTATPPTSTVTLRNFTQSSMTIGISTLKPTVDSPFTLSQTALNLAAGASASFDVALKASEVPQTAVPGTVLSDSILIDPSAPAVSQRIFGMSTTIQGAHLEYDHAAGTGPFAADAFDGANNQDVIARDIRIKNTGNYPAVPTFAVTSAGDVYSVTGALSPAAIPAATSSAGIGTIGVTFRPIANDQAQKTATLQIAAGTGDVICGALPAAVTLTGTPKMPGFRLDSADTVEFGTQGAVDCPSTSSQTAFGADVRTVTFSNTGVDPLVWTATTDNPTWLQLSSAGATLAPGATATLDITGPNLPFPPSLDENIYAGSVTIGTNIPGFTPRVIPVKRRARGAIITPEEVNASFGDVNIDFVSDELKLFTVSNTGNADATITLTGVVASTSTMGPRYWINGESATKGVNAVLTTTLTSATPYEVEGYFKPVFGTYNPAEDQVESTLTTTITTTSPVCDYILPVSLPTTGTGTDLVGFNVPANLTFATSGSPHACGAPRPENPQTVIISNYSTVSPLTIDPVTLDDNTWFTAYIGTQGNTQPVVVQPATMGTDGTYSPGTAVAVVVPKTVPTGSGAPSTLGTTLNITARLENAQPTTKTVAVRQYIGCTFP